MPDLDSPSAPWTLGLNSLQSRVTCCYFSRGWCIRSTQDSASMGFISLWRLTSGVLNKFTQSIENSLWVRIRKHLILLAVLSDWINCLPNIICWALFLVSFGNQLNNSPDWSLCSSRSFRLVFSCRASLLKFSLFIGPLGLYLRPSFWVAPAQWRNKVMI